MFKRKKLSLPKPEEKPIEDRLIFTLFKDTHEGRTYKLPKTDIQKDIVHMWESENGVEAKFFPDLKDSVYIMAGEGLNVVTPWEYSPSIWYNGLEYVIPDTLVKHVGIIEFDIQNNGDEVCFVQLTGLNINDLRQKAYAFLTTEYGHPIDCYVCANKDNVRIFFRSGMLANGGNLTLHLGKPTSHSVHVNYKGAIGTYVTSLK